MYTLQHVVHSLTYCADDDFTYINCNTRNIYLCGGGTYAENRVSQPQDGGQDAENTVDHVEWDAQHVERQSQCVELVRVRHAVDRYAARLIQIVVELGRFQLVQFHQVLVVLSKSKLKKQY